MINGVDLGKDLEGFVKHLASSDRFPSVDAVLREGVRLLEARERKLEELDAAIERGLADVKAGRLVPLDEAFDRLDAKLSTALERK